MSTLISFLGFPFSILLFLSLSIKSVWRVLSCWTTISTRSIFPLFIPSVLPYCLRSYSLSTCWLNLSQFFLGSVLLKRISYFKRSFLIDSIVYHVTSSPLWFKYYPNPRMYSFVFLVRKMKTNCFSIRFQPSPPSLRSSLTLSSFDVSSVVIYLCVLLISRFSPSFNARDENSDSTSLLPLFLFRVFPTFV